MSLLNRSVYVILLIIIIRLLTVRTVVSSPTTAGTMDIVACEQKY